MISNDVTSDLTHTKTNWLRGHQTKGSTRYPIVTLFGVKGVSLHWLRLWLFYLTIPSQNLNQYWLDFLRMPWSVITFHNAPDTTNKMLEKVLLSFFLLKSPLNHWVNVNLLIHYRNVIMSAMASLITGILIIFSTVWTVCSGADQRKHQSPALPAFFEGNSSMTWEFPAQKASDAESVSIKWRHYEQ